MRGARLLAPAFVALALVGCREGEEEAIPLHERPVEYRGAYAICSIGSVAYVAHRYGVDEATPEAIADAAARAVDATSEQAAKRARAGCLEAIAARDARGPGNESP